VKERKKYMFLIKQKVNGELKNVFEVQTREEACRACLDFDWDFGIPEGHSIANTGWWYLCGDPVEYRTEFYPTDGFISDTDISVVSEIVEI
jgi:hypothetical protein